MVEIIKLLSTLAVPVIILVIVLTGAIKKVKVYEEFVEGAKDGFTTAVKIIPYLVAMLIAIGMFRASGSHVAVSASPVVPSMLGDPAALAHLLYSDYLLHFEAVSVLLLAALVGAFVLARRENAS